MRCVVDERYDDMAITYGIYDLKLITYTEIMVTRDKGPLFITNII